MAFTNNFLGAKSPLEMARVYIDRYSVVKKLKKMGFQECFRGVVRVFQGKFKGVSRIFEGCFMVVIMLFKSMYTFGL